jgi:site-specific recombinase XerD
VDRTLITDFGTRLASQGKSRHTLAAYTRYVTSLADHAAQAGAGDWDSIRQLDCEAWLAAGIRERGWSLTTRNVALASARAFFSFLEDELWHGEHVSPVRKITSVRVTAKVPEPIGDGELSRVIAASANGQTKFTRARDEALIRLMLDSGLRREEAVSVTTAGLDFTTRRVTVTGKGGKQRRVSFGTRTSMSLRRYLKLREGHRHAARPELWLGTMGPLGVKGVYHVVTVRGQQAGVKIHPHRLRRSWAVRADLDLVELMEVAGWAGPEMARRYRSESLAVEAADKNSTNSVIDRLG